MEEKGKVWIITAERKGKSNPGFHILFCSSPSPNWKQHYENIYIVLASPPIQYHNAKSLWLTERSPNQIFGLYPEIWNAGHLLQVGLYPHFVGNLREMYQHGQTWSWSCFECLESTSKANTTSRPKLDWWTTEDRAARSFMSIRRGLAEGIWIEKHMMHEFLTRREKKNPTAIYGCAET
jgi:hypothetical protein